MGNMSLMQQALGIQWQQLPPGLQQHYASDEHGRSEEAGVLTVNYPKWMQRPLNALRLMGALLNRQGEQLPTEVKKRTDGDVQHWERSIHYPDGQTIKFHSSVVYAGHNELIEYTNALLGLRMQVYVEAETLHYESCGYVLKLGGIRLPIPEWLALGHANIKETALDETRFAMDFRLRHPLLGEIFSYAGEFEVKTSRFK